MYKVMVVDDEEWVVENLKQSIPWEKYGFQVADTALDGISAYRKVLDGRPDLIFTDIRMSGCSGLELIKRVKRDLPDTIFVIISGFAEFAYAQRAISYGVIGYCLKPIENADIVRLLEKAAGILRKRSLPEDAGDILCLSAKEGGGVPEEVGALLRSAGLGLSEEDGVGVAAVAGVGTHPLVPEDRPSLAVRTGVRQFVCLMHSGRDTPLKELLPKEIPDSVLGVGVSRPCFRAESLPGRIEEATMAAFEYFMDEDYRVFDCRDFQDDDAAVSAFFARAGKALNSGDLPEYHKLTQEAARLFEEKKMNILHAYRLYSLVFCHLQGVDMQEEYIPDYSRLGSVFGDVKTMLRKLEKYVDASVFQGAGGVETGPGNGIVDSMTEYIRSNFNSSISLRDLSDRFHISLSYASQLFKKETGRTFSDYMTGLRMEYARGLLRNSDLTVNGIAEKTGYDDFLYFRKVFKKQTGSTPTEYRRESGARPEE